MVLDSQSTPTSQLIIHFNLHEIVKNTSSLDLPCSSGETDPTLLGSHEIKPSNAIFPIRLILSFSWSLPHPSRPPFNEQPLLISLPEKESSPLNISTPPVPCNAQILPHRRFQGGTLLTIPGCSVGWDMISLEQNHHRRRIASQTPNYSHRGDAIDASSCGNTRDLPPSPPPFLTTSILLNQAPGDLTILTRPWLHIPEWHEKENYWHVIIFHAWSTLDFEFFFASILICPSPLFHGDCSWLLRLSVRTVPK
jgi:hypothetical protein